MLRPMLMLRAPPSRRVLRPQVAAVTRAVAGFKRGRLRAAARRIAEKKEAMAFRLPIRSEQYI